MIKKQFCILLAGAAAAASLLTAAPLVKSEIAKDAKWLAHIDMEGVLESSFSEIGVAKLKEAIAAANKEKITVDVDLVLSEVKSLTAYGASFAETAANESVIILKTGDRLQAIFEGLVAHQELESGQSPLKRVEGKPYQTFLLEDELYLAFPNKNYAIAGKSFQRIEMAYEVIEGKAESLEDVDQKLVLNEDAGFFLLVTANGIDSLKNVPPQARMLQKTKGGQLSIGENEGEFRANVILTTEGPKISMQLSQIVRGLLALASFTQVENQSMMEVVDSVDVQQGEDFVSLDFRYPVDKLMNLIGTAVELMDGHERGPEGDHTSSAADASAEPAQLGMLALAGHDK
ncbi:hypothetical protein IEN85_07945 [Pelagicoccus sp. NFK12]|uniref:Uncharacterized protein n=1 Tax=Pelagicoccus enzymogenes TaxID=2773457 RepID=A0A927F6P2_9BACT|nr:hypothetical protein [Pelagicoccus enzymogenes]MBD5779423.1 hypothetical protein [Pelagicoccus enzymogenes]